MRTAAEASDEASDPKQPTAVARAEKVKRALERGRTLARQRKSVEAEGALRDALRDAWGFGEPWAGYRAEALSELARCLLAQGRAAEARATVEQALGSVKPGALAADQRISELETTRGEAYRGDGQLQPALAPFETAALAAARHPRELAPALVSISLRLADTLLAVGRRQDAKVALERARRAAREPAVGRALLTRYAQALATLYDALAEPNRAQALLAELGVTGPRTSQPRRQEAPLEAPGDATKEVAAMQSDFRACYRAALENATDVAGRVALVIRIAADGSVSEVKADGAGLPGTTVDCLRRRAALARFEPPKGGGAVLTVPVTFVQQHD